MLVLHAVPRFTVAATLLAIVASGALLATIAQASRKATKSEQHAIHRLLEKGCPGLRSGGKVYRCTWHGARISTIDSRYAFASYAGPDYDHSSLVRRSTKTGHQWKVLAVVGGSLQDCTHWTSKAPLSIVREFHLTGARDGDLADVVRADDLAPVCASQPRRDQSGDAVDAGCGGDEPPAERRPGRELPATVSR